MAQSELLRRSRRSATRPLRFAGLLSATSLSKARSAFIECSKPSGSWFTVGDRSDPSCDALGCRRKGMKATSLIPVDSLSSPLSPTTMPEGLEIRILRRFIVLFIKWMKEKNREPDLRIKSLWADMVAREENDMKVREDELLAYATTLTSGMLGAGTHRSWVDRLSVLAESVPDTHGLLIRQVWGKLPRVYRKQVSSNYASWPDFCDALRALSPEHTTKPAAPEELPDEARKAGVVYDRPSNSHLAYRLGRYTPLAWRGRNPDRKPVDDKDKGRGNGGEQERGETKGQSGTKSKGQKRKKERAEDDDYVPSGKSLKKTTLDDWVRGGTARETTQTNKPQKKAMAPHNESRPQQKTLSSFSFTSLSRLPTDAGLSSKLTGFGLSKSGSKKMDEPLVDYSRYLWPSHLFPVLNDESVDVPDAMDKTGMALVGVEYDSRDLVLNLKSCFLEARPFKIVLALEMNTHVLAWLSSDNNARMYWLSVADIEKLRPLRVPDIVFDFWNWGKFTVNWLKKTGSAFDHYPISRVLTMAGHQPTRGVGNKFLRHGMELNQKRGPDSFMIFTSPDDVERQLVCVTSQRAEKPLWHTMFKMSEGTHRVSASGRKNIFDTNHSMADAPSTFDIGEVADAVLNFDGLGPTLLGSDWEWQSKLQAAVTPQMRKFYQRLLPDLSTVQRLSLKPLPDLTPSELALVVKARGDTVNPLVQYWMDSKPPTVSANQVVDSDSDLDNSESMLSEESELTELTDEGDTSELTELTDEDDSDLNTMDIDVDLEPAPIVMDRLRARLPTKVYKVGQSKKKDYLWTVLTAPLHTTCPNESISPRDGLVFQVMSDLKRRQGTIRYVKRHTRKYTVGPMEFCGHAKVFKYGQKSWVYFYTLGSALLVASDFDRERAGLRLEKLE
ncbi:hypothetical protein B0H12DRAFT_1072110 [Mycena haematopus]|nr:hypothetical protein B0H12DRAFT_1072110 [Mycena haematopus]